jgi:hypothetical protein
MVAARCPNYVCSFQQTADKDSDFPLHPCQTRTDELCSLIFNRPVSIEFSIGRWVEELCYADIMKTILRTTAFLIGVASLVGVCVSAYHDFHGDSEDVSPAVFLLIFAAAGLLLFFTWRREFTRDPAMVPAAILAFCTAFCDFGLLPKWFPPGHYSSWFTLVFGMHASVVSSWLGIILITFVYFGSLSFLRIAFNARRSSSGRSEVDAAAPNRSLLLPQQPIPPFPARRITTADRK